MSQKTDHTDPVAAAKALLPELAARANEMDEVRRLPADLACTMAEASVFRLVTPRRFGGLEASPRTFVETVETLSTANASAGWCCMIANTSALNAAYMAPEEAEAIFDDPHVITGGVFAPMGRAVVEEGGYRVTGRWQWGSGSANSVWLGGGCTVWENGEMRRLPSGAPETLMAVFPAAEAALLDTWHVMGLKGTGSGDFEVTDIFVPEGRCVRLAEGNPRETGPLYKFPAFGFLSLGVCAAALGNARGSLDNFHALAMAKKNQGSAKTLAERQTIQSAYAQAEASWRAARALLFAEIDRVWEIAQTADEIPMEARADLRLACTHVTRTGADICRNLYELGGGAALFETSPLQRQFRDAQAMTQHIITAPATWELTGRILFGLPTDGGMV
ncbi:MULTISPECIES: acyl-CoA dehydrogenase family protein [Hyphomonas]|uniref:Hydrolase n=1 Tax=Hyphomonas adhaerens TaxID=81029 RepID=A0A3B9H0U5_9PROT|nr:MULTISPECIES: acyl-CoA dehydrogenase family protein [Hyphomonas]MBB39766.1 hydrolase [Hyphomonas sp.]HAE28290.1 hydrolase [Hyphomonas adhaerens]|tara:strand:+ start:13818 stop:14987 length:1170 start_codon:yes stop_codon:yes gene_type:complete